MKFKIVSKGGFTSLVDVETGRSLPVKALRFEHASPDDLPTLTFTLQCINEIEVDAEMTANGATTLNPVLRDGRPAVEIVVKSAPESDAIGDGTWREREALL